MKLIAIPNSVLNLIARQWLADPIDRRRCVYRPDSPNAAINGLRYAEVRALVADGVMTNDWRGPGDAIAINEHEKNALREFCSGVYEAWDRFQASLGPNWSEPPERQGRLIVRASVIMTVEPSAYWRVQSTSPLAPVVTVPKMRPQLSPELGPFLCSGPYGRFYTPARSVPSARNRPARI
jgi:hypothetical protein